MIEHPEGLVGGGHRNCGEANLFSVIIVVQQRPYASASSSTIAFYRVPVSIWHYQPRAMDMPTPINDPGPALTSRSATTTP